MMIMLTIMTKRALTIKLKGIKPYRITTIIYMITAVFLRTVQIIKKFLTVIPIIVVIANIVVRVRMIFMTHQQKTIQVLEDSFLASYVN